ncbi:MAG: Bug family tripartite tricarboxylate transporter substrate binding protein [Burkholderiales bacterium]
MKSITRLRLIRPGVIAQHAAAFALLAATEMVAAQSWPAKPVRLIVPYAPGGSTDNYARAFGPKFSETWGQPVIVENRPGAGGNIGAAMVAKAAPDGYTILLNTSGQALAPALMRKLPFDPAKDLQPVMMLLRGVNVLMVSPAVTASTARDLIAQIKAQPGKFNYGSSGVGSGPHLAGELLRSLAGLDIVHVPYKGDAALVPAILANEVQFTFMPGAAATPLVRAGRLRPLAVASATRSISLPEVPPLAESGVPNYDLSTWAALFVPTGTPRDIVHKISAEGVRVMNLPDIQKIVANWGVEPVGIGVDAFEVRYKEEIAKYARIIREAGIPQQD